MSEAAPGPALVPSPTEEEIFSRYREGDRQAFRELVLRYRAPVYGYLVRCGVPEGDRDDLFQDIFIKIHRAAPTYDNGRPLHPWLFTIVANTVRNYHRRRRVDDRLFSEPLGGDVPDGSPVGERALGASEMVRWLETEMMRLPPVQREVLVLAAVENLALKEIAEALKVPLNTVKTHLRRARLRLMERLESRHRTPGKELS